MQKRPARRGRLLRILSCPLSTSVHLHDIARLASLTAYRAALAHINAACCTCAAPSCARQLLPPLGEFASSLSCQAPPATGHPLSHWQSSSRIRNPTQHSLMPDLPLDVLNLIFRALDASLDPSADPDNLERRRKVGRNVSLVCRKWLPLGGKLVWSHVEIADMRARRAASLVEHLIAHPRVAAYVSQVRINWRPSSAPQGLSYAEHRLPTLLRRLHSLIYLSLLDPPTLVIRSLSTTPPIRFPALTYLQVGADLPVEAGHPTLSLADSDLRTLLQLSSALGVLNLQCALSDQTPPATVPVPPRPLASIELRFTGNTRDVALATQTVLQSADPASVHQLVIANVPFSPLFYRTVATFPSLFDMRLGWEFEDGLAFSLPQITTLVQQLPGLHLLGLMYDHEPAVQDDHDLSNRLLELVPSTLNSAVLTLAYTSLDAPPIARYARANLGTGPRELAAITQKGEITFFQNEDEGGTVKWEEVDREPLEGAFAVSCLCVRRS